MYALIEYVRFEIKRIKNNNKITVFRVGKVACDS